MSKAVGVLIDGVVVWHARGVFDDFVTLCGIDSVVPSMGHQGVLWSQSAHRKLSA